MARTDTKGRQADTDPDQLEQSLAALRKSEELRRLFMDSSSATFALFDSELNFLDINVAGLDRFRLTREDVIGRNLADISAEVVTSGRFDRYLEVIRTGKPLRLESVAYEARDGRHSVLEMRAFRVADGLGVIIEDITERKKRRPRCARARIRYSYS